MRTIGKAVRTAACGTALMLMALPGISAAAEQGGMSGMQHGDHTGMKMEGHDHAAHGGHDMKMGEKIFSGKVGPWTAEARLVDMKAQMEQSGVSAATAAKFAGKRHLMSTKSGDKRRDLNRRRTVRTGLKTRYVRMLQR